MSILTCGFEGGSDGAAMTTAAGDASPPFNAVSAGPTFSTTRAAHGTTSMLIANPGVAQQVVRWAPASTSRIAVRSYVWLTALPTVDMDLIQIALTGDTTAAVFRLNSAGRARLTTAGGVIQATDTFDFPINQWVRIEIYLNASGGDARAAYAIGDSGTLNWDTGTLAGITALIDTSFVNVRLGKQSSGSYTGNMWVDSVAAHTEANATGLIGPVQGASLRSGFGGTTNDIVLGRYRFGERTLLAELATPKTVTFWNAEVDGIQYTDLLDAASLPVTQVKTVGGYLPRFQGPDNITAMWADDGDGERRLLEARDLLAAAGIAADVAADAADADAARDQAQTAAAAAQAVGNNNDSITAGIVNNALSLTTDALRDLYVRQDTAVDVRAFGAVGDGSVDDTAAIQAAVNSLPAGGGTVVFPPGLTFLLNGNVVMRSNQVYRATGATFLKQASTLTTYYAFICRAQGGTAYGSGGENIRFIGGKFKGSFLTGSQTGISITMNKARNVVIEGCWFQEATISGHPIDMGGCDGVTIRDCTFEGWRPTTDLEYVEAIQVDHSLLQGNQVDQGFPASYDGAPTKNVLVENCRSIPLSYQVNATNYPAPNLVGSHSRVQDRWLENITIRDCYMTGGRETTNITDAFALLARGWIHFMWARNVKIINNEFVNVSGRETIAIHSRTLSTAVLLTDTALASPVAQTVTPLPATGWLVEGNTFRGFNGLGTGEDIIRINGTTASTPSSYVANIDISKNFFYDCFGGTPGTPSATSGTCIYIQLCKDISITGNKAGIIRSLWKVEDSFDVLCAQNKIPEPGVSPVGGAHWYVGQVADSVRVKIINNTIWRHGGGLWHSACTKLEISGNDMTSWQTGTLAYPQHITVSGGSTALVLHNECQSVGGSTNVDQGIYVFGSFDRCRVNYNVVIGPTNNALPVRNGAGNINFVETGTVNT